LLLLAFLTFALILLSIVLFKVMRVKRRFLSMGVEISFQQALNMLLQGGYEQGVAEAAARAAELDLEVPMDKLQIHAASGGNPLRIVEAMAYARECKVKSAKAGLKHISLIDLSGKDPLETIKEAEQSRTVEVSGQFEFSGRLYDYHYRASFFRPVLSIAFDSFSMHEIERELKRKIEDLHRYHKELLRVDAGQDDQIRDHLTQNVLRPAYWERSFRLVLHKHSLDVKRIKL